MKKKKLNKIEQEKYIVDQMILLYCKKNHKSKTLCPACEELSTYCHKRLSLCPFKEKKTFCSNCPIHCYDRIHKDKIREVMRFSGPRMLFYHPVLAIKHLIETKREKRGKKKDERKQSSQK